MRPAGTFTDRRVRSHEVFAPDAAAPTARRRRLIVLGTLGVAGLLGAGVTVRVVRRAAAERRRRPAFVQLAITPWGEVLIDGEHRGTTPPLKRIDVSPGRHTIEVRNAPNPPVAIQVELQPGEDIVVRHAFSTARPALAQTPAQPAAQKSSQRPSAKELWREFRRSLPFRQ